MVEGIGLYITAGLVVILVILFIILFIKRRGDVNARKKVLDAFKERGYIVEERKTKSTIGNQVLVIGLP